MEAAHTIAMYDDNSSGIARAGLRQTDLSVQLENSNKKKHRNKTQSVLYNGAMAKSKSSLFDGTSLFSEVSSGDYQSSNNQASQQQQQQQQQMMMANQQMAMAQQGYAGYPQVQYNAQMYSSSNHSNPSFQQGYYPQQGYYSQGQYPNYQQQQQQNYLGANQAYPGYQYAPQQQQQQQQGVRVAKQRKGKKGFRESYMYLNSVNTSGELINMAQQPQVNMPVANGSPTPSLQRRFSAQNGGVVGSPMSMTNDENARKLAFPTIMNGMGHALNVNDGDHANHGTTVNDWESIDEDDDDEEDYEDEDEDVDESEYDSLSKAELQKILLSVKGENKGLKKKLKDIELGHDSSSIVANDEKYIKLEEEFSDLATKYVSIESEVENLTNENETYLKDIALLKAELKQSEAAADICTTLSRTMIERIPNFVKQKDSFFLIMGDTSDIPEQLQECYTRSVEKYQGEGFENPADGNLSDSDIMKMLKNEVRDLQAALTRSENTVKQLDKIYSQKLHEERRTIIVSSLQKTLHNEFVSDHSNAGARAGLKHFRIVDICPSAEPQGGFLSPSIPNSASSPSLNNNWSSSSGSSSLTPDHSHSRVVYLSPISPPSSSGGSPTKRISLYSGNSVDHFKDAFSTIPNSSSNPTIAPGPAAAAANSFDTSLEIEYETFTA